MHPRMVSYSPTERVGEPVKATQTVSSVSLVKHRLPSLSVQPAVTAANKTAASRLRNAVAVRLRIGRNVRMPARVMFGIVPASGR